MKARIKMISDALPNKMINFLTICCPMKAANVATAEKYRAAKKVADDQDVRRQSKNKKAQFIILVLWGIDLP